MNSISPKVTAGAGGVGLGGALLIVLLWAFHSTPPPEVVAAMGILMSSATGGFLAWLTPHVPPTVMSALDPASAAPSPEVQNLASKVTAGNASP